MARSDNNLSAVFTDTANAIRSKTGTSSAICPRDFADEIAGISVGGADTAVDLLTANIYKYTLPSEIGTGNKELRQGAFAFANNIIDFDFNNEKIIPESCFYSNSTIKSVRGNNVEIIFSSAFNNCVNLSHISFPNCKFFAGTNIFYLSQTYGLSLIDFNLNGLIIAGEASGTTRTFLFSASFASDVNFPNLEVGFNTLFSAVSGSGVLSMPKLINMPTYGFPNCSFSSIYAPEITCMSGGFQANPNITALTLKYAVATGSSYFANCTKLSYFDNEFGGVFGSTLGAPNCFQNCRELQTLIGIFNGGGQNAFSNCSKLTEVKIGTYIANSCFANCQKLDSVYMLDVSASLQNVNAFNSTPMSASSWIGHWGSIYVPSSALAWYKASTNWITYSDRITALPSEFDSKYVYANEFISNTNITSIPADKLNVEHVLSNAFRNCSNLTGIVSLPNCKTIDELAFINCSNISGLYLPNCVTIKNSVFYGMKPTESIINLPKVRYLGSQAFQNTGSGVNPITYNLPECKFIHWSAFSNAYVKDISAPELIVFLNVQSMYSISSIYFPKCRYFGGLNDCKSLVTLSLPETLLLGAFYSCTNLQTIDAPKTMIIAGTIQNCPMSALSFPNLVSFGGALNTLNNLSTFYAPNLIYFQGISSCSAITKLRLDKLRYFANTGIRSCRNLSKVMLQNLETFSNAQIYSCSKLMSLYLFKNVVVNCTSSDILSQISLTAINDSSYTGSFGSIYVPATILSEYQNDPKWSPLSERLVGLTDEQMQSIIDHWDD